MVFFRENKPPLFPERGYPPQLVLASASARRVSLLGQIGLSPDVICPTDIDEEPRRYETPRHLSHRLACAKVEAVEGSSLLPVPHPRRYILGADTVVAIGRRSLGKPSCEEEAREMLLALSGRAHRVYTSVCLSPPGGRIVSRIVETKIRFKRLSREEMLHYIASGEWRTKAGGYAIQGLADSFVRFLSGSYSAVVGLPLQETRALLLGAGYPCFSL